MDKTETIKEILQTLYPDEYIIAGEEAVSQIIREESNTNEFYRTRGGNDFDIGNILLLISNTILIIKNALDIFEKYKNVKKEKDVIVREVIERIQGKMTVSNEQVNAVVYTLLKK